MTGRQVRYDFCCGHKHSISVIINIVLILGMASIVLSPNANAKEVLPEIIAACTSRLPAYARPYFIRIMESVAVTGTFKFQKSDLVKQGYNPALTENDALYFCSWKNDAAFVLIETKFFESFMQGKVPF